MISINKEYKTLTNNVFYLGILQVSNYILPLITIPYLVKTIGVDNFGLLSLATAISTYFILLTDYGFNLTATKKVSLNRVNRKALNKILSTVITIKIILMFIGALILLSLINLVPMLNENKYVFIFSYGVVLGHVLFPQWMFQGMEEMKYITILSFISKLIPVVLIFSFVNKPDDFGLVPIFYTLGSVFSGIIALILVFILFKLKLRFFSFNYFIEILKEGWHIFYASLSVSIYTNSTVVFLGLMTNVTAVGYYSAAEKIISALKVLYSAVSQALFPFLNLKYKESSDNAARLLRKIIIIFIPMAALISTLVFMLSESLVYTLYGKDMYNSIILLKILSPVFFLVVLSNIFGVQTMIVFGFKKEFSRILTISAFIGVVSNFLFVPVFAELGSAISVVIAEVLVTTLMFNFIKNKRLILI